MTEFHTVRDAKEYLIRRILEQADRDGVHLSDVERDMLYFSETGWTLPNMMTISREFDQHYDQDEYESKFGQIIRRIHDQPDSNRDEWNQAMQRLREEDHYLLVLIDGASSEPGKTSRWEIVKYLLVGGVVALALLPIGFFLESHVINPVLSKWIFEGTALILVVLAAFLATRSHRKSA